MFEHVLAPVDFSPRDEAAAHYLRQLRAKVAFKTTLLHVVPPPDYEAAVLEAGGPILQELMDTRRRLGKEKLQKTCVPELEGMAVDRVLREGFPSEEIVNFAREAAVDLIVMPTHGYGPFRRFLLGSVTSKVLHDSMCPVFTGAHMEEPKLEEIHFERVAAAVDLSENSPRVIEYAARLAKALGAKLVILHAMAGLKGHVGITFESENDFHFEIAVKERLAELTKGLDPAAETMIETGPSAPTVSAMLKSTGSDVVVIGRSSSTGMASLRAETYSIIRESPVPVLSV